MNKKVIIFGAGNIGRSFIAPVFIDGGYEIVFVDIAPTILSALEKHSSYKVVYKSDKGEKNRIISPVRGVDGKNTEAVQKELNDADLCVTCVGAKALPAILCSIAQGVLNRTRPFDIILAENLKGAAGLTRQKLQENGIESNRIGNNIGIVETSIGKMVPIMPRDVVAQNPLLCWAEEFNTLIVDADGFTGPLPLAPDIMPVSPIAPWVARKLYIHNFGHAATAYLGYKTDSNIHYVWEALANPSILSAVKKNMQISGQALQLEYPGIFTATEIEEHITDLLSRFQNKVLGDTIYRVGRDLRRKLHRQDRVVGALELARKHGLQLLPSLKVFQAGLTFAALQPDGTPNKADAEIRKTAENPPLFLSEVVQVDINEEKELYNLLLHCMQNR